MTKTVDVASVTILAPELKLKEAVRKVLIPCVAEHIRAMMKDSSAKLPDWCKLALSEISGSEELGSWCDDSESKTRQICADVLALVDDLVVLPVAANSADLQVTDRQNKTMEVLTGPRTPI